MNRMERLTAIVLTIRERQRTCEEIASYFEVSKRTILRDVQALCEMGVPVIATGGPGGGYSLPGDYTFSPLPLTLSTDRGLWYCEAYSHEHREIRRYRADRFVTVAPADPPPDWDGQIPETDYHDPSYPEVIVELTPHGVLVAEREPHLSVSI